MKRQSTTKLGVAALLAGPAAASSIRADSRVGRTLLSKARRLDGEDADASWVTDYSLVFQKCATTTSYDGNENKWDRPLVHFSLCPSRACDQNGNPDCSEGGDYVIDMEEFAIAYAEHKVAKEAEVCATALENCACDNYYETDDEIQLCQNLCYTNVGLYDVCVPEFDKGFALEEAVGCAQLEVDPKLFAVAAPSAAPVGSADDTAANWYLYGSGGSAYGYFVGPHCDKDKGEVLLKVYKDNACSKPATKNTYEKLFYGKSLPYSISSFISKKCVSCNDDYNYYSDFYGTDDWDGLGLCQGLYEGVDGKCEFKLRAEGVYPDTMACEFISGLPKPSLKFSSLFGVPQTVMAGVIALSTLVFGGAAYYFHKKHSRQNVALDHGELVDGDGEESRGAESDHRDPW